MTIPPTLALATRNPGKMREILEICRDWPLTWVTYDPEAAGRTWPEVEETGSTYLENALLKARAVSSALRVPAVADDSGIEVDALGGAPGVLSAYFAGPRATDEQNLALLLERVRAQPATRRSARYRCVAACAWPDGGARWAEGVCEGRVTTEPRGSGGFGYDPAFVPAGFDRTMAELEPAEKDRISHRGRAFRGLEALLREA